MNSSRIIDRIINIIFISILVLCGLVIYGWIFNIPLLKSIKPEWIPMKPVTVLCLALYAVTLKILHPGTPPGFRRIAAIAACLITGIISIITVFTFTSEYYTGSELFLTTLPVLNLFLEYSMRMSLATSVAFLLLSISYLIMSVRINYADSITHILLLIPASTFYLISIGYIFNISGINTWLKITPALHTSLAILFLCLGTFLIRRDTWLMRVLYSAEAGGAMARRLLPGVFIIPLIVGWFRIRGESAGLYNSQVGVMLVVMAYTFILYWLVWLAARSVNLIDKERKAREDALFLSEERYRTLFDTLIEGFCTIEMVFDKKGKPVDYRFLEINPAFEKQTGLHNVQGRLMRDIAPDNEEHWFEIYGKVALTGNPVQFENEAKALGRYYDVTAYRIGGQGSGKVAILFNDITGRKLAEQKLKENQLRLEALFAAIPDVIVEYDINGKVVRANDSALQILGLNTLNFTRDQAVSKLKFANLDNRPLNITDLPTSRALKGERVAGEQYSITVADKGNMIIATYAIPIYNDGKITGVLGLWHDITELKKAENETARLMVDVVEEKDRLSSLINSITDEVWFADTYGKFTIANTSALKEFKLDNLNDLNIQKFAESLEVFNSDGKPRSVDESPPLRALKGETIIKQEEMIRTPATGELRYRQVSSSPVRDFYGRIIGSVSIVRDITDIKRAAQDLKEKEERYRLIVETMVQGVVHQDADGTIISMNHAAEQILGKTFAQFIGSSSEKEEHDTIREDGTPYPGVEHPAMVALRSGQTIAGNIMGVFNPQINKYRWIKIDAIPLFLTGDKSPSEVYTIFEDITDQKLSDEKLKLTLEELTRSNSELDDFTYIASHDLREPLRGIRNYSSMMLEDYSGLLDEQGKSMLHTLVKLTSRLDTYIQSLLEYSKLGSNHLKTSNVSVREVIDEVIESIRFSIDERCTKITVADNLPVIECDRSRLIAIYTNLISNSLKYNDKAERIIDIGFENQAESKSSKPTFFVRDNGIGINMKFRDKVFQIFKRLHPRDRYGGGSGAGLTIVKKCIEMHGGKIWFESEPDMGTTFYFIMEGAYKNYE